MKRLHSTHTTLVLWLVRPSNDVAPRRRPIGIGRVHASWVHPASSTYTPPWRTPVHGLSSAASTTARGRKQCSACGWCHFRSNTTQSTSTSICGEEHRGCKTSPPQPATSAILLVGALSTHATPMAARVAQSSWLHLATTATLTPGAPAAQSAATLCQPTSPPPPPPRMPFPSAPPRRPPPPPPIHHLCLLRLQLPRAGANLVRPRGVSAPRRVAACKAPISVASRGTNTTRHVCHVVTPQCVAGLARTAMD